MILLSSKNLFFNVSADFGNLITVIFLNSSLLFSILPLFFSILLTSSDLPSLHFIALNQGNRAYLSTQAPTVHQSEVIFLPPGLSSKFSLQSPENCLHNPLRTLIFRFSTLLLFILHVSQAFLLKILFILVSGDLTEINSLKTFPLIWAATKVNDGQE